jgi:predicted acyltransferase
MTISNNQRFVTLDVFRGMTVFLMIVVNTQGSGAQPYAQLEHAAWNGSTLTDLVFPSFLFAVGNALVFAGKKLALLPEETALYRIGKRTCLLFLAGYLLSWYPFVAWDGQGHVWWKPLAETRIMAVLQRIALTYGATALLARYLSVKQLIVVCIVILLGYWAVLYVFGDFTMQGNAVRRLDLFILGERHMYKERGVAFDPEGILSTIPAIVNVLCGYLTGWYMVRKGKVGPLLVTGALLLILAFCWSAVFPFNKKLWTSSYVLLTAGIDIIMLCILYYILETRRWRTGSYFFVVFGKNPLFIYILSNLLGPLLIIHITGNMALMDWLNTRVFQAIAPGPMGCLLFSLFFTMICWLAGWVMDKKRWYVRL